MAEYIDREALEKAMTIAAVNGKDKDLRTWAKAICVLHDMPTADVEPVVRGWWVRKNRHDKESSVICSVCGRTFDYIDGVCYLVSGSELPFFCPACGAKMDGKEGKDG